MSERTEIFREHRKEIWRGLMEHLEQGEWDGRPIEVKHGPFPVVLDVHAEGGGYASRVVTRLRAAYQNKDGFRCRVRRANWLSDIATMLGTQDYQVGDERFDKEFIVQGTNEEAVKRFFADSELRELIFASPVDLGEIRDDEGDFGPEFPEGIDELYIHSRERLTAIEDIEAFYNVFAELLNRLCHLGSAYEDDPEIEI